jgi:hypothetical protein
LRPDNYDQWLDPKNEDVDGLAKLLVPYPDAVAGFALGNGSFINKKERLSFLNRSPLQPNPNQNQEQIL